MTVPELTHMTVYAGGVNSNDTIKAERRLRNGKGRGWNHIYEGCC
jgi:hypothetical protein